MPVTVAHTTPSDGSFSATGAAAWDANHSVVGLGTLAEQNSNSIAVTGGAINGTTIGAVTASTGAFTTLSASSTVSGTGFSTYLASPPAIGGTAAAAGSFTTLSASSTVSGTGFSTYLASPPAIGGTAAAAGSFTTLSASSTVSGTGFSTYLASPPAIGGTAAAAGSFTTLSASGAFTAGSSVGFNSLTAAINLGGNHTTGVFTVGGASGTGILTLGRSTVSQTTNIQAGATASGSTKTINLGTEGLAGSTTAIAIGSTAGTSTITLNGAVSVSSTIAAALGSAAAPSHTFTGDTNTGMWSPAADTIAFSEGGAEAMRIDSSGSVGIGTSSPSFYGKLTVNGNIVLGAPESRNSATTRQIGIWTTGDPADDSRANIGFTTIAGGASSNSIITFATNNYGVSGGERMRIASAGNVGIGTTSPNSAALLDVTSTTSGFLPPRMTTVQQALILTPPNGLMLYNTTTNKLQVYAAGVWVDLH